MSTFAKRKETLGTSLAKVHAQVRQTSDKVEKARNNSADKAATKAQWVSALNLVFSRSADVCNDMLSARDADPWATAFAYTTQFCLANLANARFANNADVQIAMVSNLVVLADELYGAFPSGKRVVTDWRTSINELRKLLPPDHPTTLSEVHPFAGTIGRQLSILKNRGYPMSGLTEFYAPGDSGLHMLRPT